jgi:hypothetical protein
MWQKNKKRSPNYNHASPCQLADGVQLISVHPVTKEISWGTVTPKGWEDFWS